jgi:hypothetical protein
MKYWMHCTPAGLSGYPIWSVYSEDAIIAEYWDSWSKNMRKYNIENDLDPHQDINQENCVEDWVCINWAIPCNRDTILEIIPAPNPTNCEI